MSEDALMVLANRLGVMPMLRRLAMVYWSFERRYFLIQMKKDAERYGKLVNANLMGLRFMLDLTNIHDYITFKALQTKGYEPETTEYIRNNLSSGMTFYDLGASNGYYTLLASKLVGDSGMVYSVEANPRTYFRLKQNVELNNLKNVKIYNLALADYEGSADLFLEPGAEDGLASLMAAKGREVVARVQVTTFDNLFDDQRVDIVKMDVEGSEIAVIRGMLHALQQNPNMKIIMEWNPSYRTLDDYRYLSQRFSLYKILPDKKSKFMLKPVRRYEDLHFGNILLEQL